MEGTRIIIHRVDDEGSGCCGIEIEHGKTLIVLDRHSDCIHSSRLDPNLERTVIFDSERHCNSKPNTENTL